MVLRFQWNVLVFLFCLLGCSLPAAAETVGNSLYQHLQKKKPLASLTPSWLDVQPSRLEVVRLVMDFGKAGLLRNIVLAVSPRVLTEYNGGMESLIPGS